MIFKRIIFTLSLLFSLGFLWSQEVLVSPTPQSVVWGTKAFNNTVAYKIIGEATADSDAVNLLKNKLNITASGVEIVMGERGDDLVAAYASEIPAYKEAYFLKVEPARIIIAGNDTIGTYYGVQTLLQILRLPEVMTVTIKDYPDVIDRGVVEGFYGNPFSQADRISQFRFYGENKMNVYIYGPKDDPYHGFSNRWRDPYPAADALRIKELIQEAHRNKVNFVWAVHPGNDIKWVDNNGDGVIDDFKACVNKFELMYNLGVRAFAVFFDDIGGVGTDPVNQAKMMNYLTTEFVNKKHDVAPLILCPTQYNQAWSGGDYLTILGTQMDSSVRIMWTGKSVVRMIDKETMDWINPRIKRNAYIWLNYPVTDYVIDHLLMGPVVGNATTIASQLAGFTANPMEYAEASKVALFSIADYTWNMKKFNPQTSWINGLRYLQPNNFEAFKIFCENNIDLGSTFHGLRMSGESASFKTVADPVLNAYRQGQYNASQIQLLSDKFQSFRNASAELLASTYNPAMISEIAPWLRVFDMMGEKGLYLLDMYKALNENDSVIFVQKYLKIDSIETAQKKVISRGFAGSIKSPNPKPANEVVAPFIKQIKSLMVMDYRRKFKYMLNVFPQVLIEEGRYYIKVDGKYLTNTNVNGSGGTPTFVAYRDTINPQRQEWTISMDALTERYKVANAQDGRYINELGNFGTNTFEAAWNTYNMHRQNGKYAIQNAGSAGDKFWMFETNRIKPSTNNKLGNSVFVFEIVPVGNEQVNHPKITPGETYYIKSGDLYLSNNNVSGSGGNPGFKALATTKLKSQQWNFVADATTDRYKIISAADSRYINELGAFGTNAYFASWNSYVLTEMGGLFAIQNAGDAGTNFWSVSNSRINKGNETLQNSYIFEIIPTSVLFPTGLKKLNLCNKFKMLFSDGMLSVEGDDVKNLSLYNMGGMLMNCNQSGNSLSVSSVNPGVYVLQVDTLSGERTAMRVLLQ
jgi:hyaluronoglucosaminidase